MRGAGGKRLTRCSAVDIREFRHHSVRVDTGVVEVGNRFMAWRVWRWGGISGDYGWLTVTTCDIKLRFNLGHDLAKHIHTCILHNRLNFDTKAMY